MPNRHPKRSKKAQLSDGTPKLLIPGKNASESSQFVIRFARMLSRMDGVSVCAIFLLSRTSPPGLLAQDPWLGFYASILRLIDELGQAARNAGPKDRAATRVATYVGLIWARINVALGVREDLAIAEVSLGLASATVAEVTAVAAEKVAEAQPVPTELVPVAKKHHTRREQKPVTTLDVLGKAKKKADEEGLLLTMAKIAEAQAMATKELEDRARNAANGEKQGGAQ